MTTKNIVTITVDTPIRLAANDDSEILEKALQNDIYDVLVIIDIDARNQWIKIRHDKYIDAYIRLNSNGWKTGEISTIPLALSTTEPYNRGYVDARRYALLQMREWCDKELKKIT